MKVMISLIGATTKTRMAYRHFLWKFRGGRRTSVVSSIPEEIQNDILLRLPVKSLLACKCACKNWYALISTSDFINSHVTIQKNNPILMLKDDSIHLYSIGFDSLPSSSSSVCEIKDNVIIMDHPLKYVGFLTECSSRSCIGFLGSSNGLICIWLLCFCYQPIGFRESFCLWNPATREYKELPESPIGLNRGNVCMHGFGYDHKTDDYKLAIGVEAPGSKDTTLVQVYTLASSLWKTEKTIPYRLLCMHMSGVLVNGNLHWLALGQYNFLLLSLDISDENFKEMQLPREIPELNKDMCLGVLQGCLCLLVSSDVNGVKNYSEVWEMLDYGVRESWTKRHVIAHESIINKQKYFRLVQSFKNDEFLLLSDDILVLYDPKHGSARELKIDNVPFRNAETYFESLVSLNSGTYEVGGYESLTDVLARVRNNRKRRRLMFLIYVLVLSCVVYFCM
ncbi:F-box protein CPR1-like [Papaver somniferum]|uniref:F-box protein CPR1-like n=1 Tax=Papaver somniferum TaxID=3469 RepID=UPI000E7055E4|nr:F-box protein CPR1-like [Papaver somniferum]XP_026421162.1 F-box protein CPR1-like [Papaver somniferum]